jgi:hypothetical protein
VLIRPEENLSLDQKQREIDRLVATCDVSVEFDGNW